MEYLILPINRFFDTLATQAGAGVQIQKLIFPVSIIQIITQIKYTACNAYQSGVAVELCICASYKGQRKARK